LHALNLNDGFSLKQEESVRFQDCILKTGGNSNTRPWGNSNTQTLSYFC